MARGTLLANLIVIAGFWLAPAGSAHAVPCDNIDYTIDNSSAKKSWAVVKKFQVRIKGGSWKNLKRAKNVWTLHAGKKRLGAIRGDFSCDRKRSYRIWVTCLKPGTKRYKKGTIKPYHWEYAPNDPSKLIRSVKVTIKTDCP